MTGLGFCPADAPADTPAVEARHYFLARTQPADAAAEGEPLADLCWSLAAGAWAAAAGGELRRAPGLVALPFDVLVGADGTHSVVRAQAGAGFAPQGVLTLPADADGPGETHAEPGGRLAQVTSSGRVCH
jgi:hypothetical protein